MLETGGKQRQREMIEVTVTVPKSQETGQVFQLLRPLPLIQAAHYLMVA